MKDLKQARSQRQEREGMLRFGGQQNPRSGATPTRKNDGRTHRNLGNELIEFKRTDNKKQITIKLVDLLGVEVHALAESRLPILGFDLGGRHYVVMPEEVYLERSAASIRPSLARNGDGEGIRTNASVDEAREMRRDGAPTEQSLLRRVPRQPGGSSGKSDLSGRGISGRRRVPSALRVSQTRDRETGATRGMGRSIRTRASENTTGNRADRQ